MSEYTPEMARAAVERGAAWLDKQCPDWLSHIDPKSLDLGEPRACVLGQTAECITGMHDADYSVVLHEIDRTQRWAIMYGFSVPLPRGWISMQLEKYEQERSARFEVLTLTWRELIRERLAVPA